MSDARLAAAMAPEKSLRSRRVDLDVKMKIRREEDKDDGKSAFKRARPQLKTGMESLEEREVHIKKAIEQQAAGAASTVAIPIPQIREVPPERLAGPPFELPDTYLRLTVPAWNDPDCGVLYDMDADDLEWLNAHNAKNRRISEDDFEALIDRLEKATNFNVVPVELSAITLPPTVSEKTGSIIREYWMAKRVRLDKPLLRPFWPPPDHDNSDPHLAFRPLSRTYSRRKKPNDMTSYKKLCQLKKEFETVMELLQEVFTREETKRDLAALRIEIFEQLRKEDKSGNKFKLQLDLPPPPRPRPAPKAAADPAASASAPTSAAAEATTPAVLDPTRPARSQSTANKAYTTLLQRAKLDDVLAESDDDTEIETLASHLESVPLPIINRIGIRCLYMDPASHVRMPNAHAFEAAPPTSFLAESVPASSAPGPPAIGAGGYPTRVIRGVAPEGSRPRKFRAVRRIGRGGRILYDRVLPSLSDSDSDSDGEPDSVSEFVGWPSSPLGTKRKRAASRHASPEPSPSPLIPAHPTLFSRPVTRTSLYLDALNKWSHSSTESELAGGEAQAALDQLRAVGPPSRLAEYVHLAQRITSLKTMQLGPMAEHLGYRSYDASLDLSAMRAALDFDCEQDAAGPSLNESRLRKGADRAAEAAMTKPPPVVIPGATMLETPTVGSYLAGAVVMVVGVILPLAYIVAKHRGLAWKPSD
ncbi:uncharacterized protein AMSG_07295 [Thecamonas trahens ATCC 50062]|uniref:Enhancer of polycomb-like protein n=1 Tax=Thecamonas trahens ATCC 50062 TaxID=461836 RepID=A0A0L0DIY7_THETB|nr:hypothetical protein AMSG_07295 [Thecamonas trahens ATCC 50062]KNC51288.1 hypothetical protein AMSG_07295 [Thecamonas trahens ATCC 50062]|eukprot:XP_013756213.1 hypothetical protein AMSG_07295 [Thecamonas trahens ATCC 50062]